MSKVTVEFRTAYYDWEPSSEMDYAEIFVNGVRVGDEYEVSSQYWAILEALKVLGVEYTAHSTAWTMNDNGDWIKELGVPDE